MKKTATFFAPLRKIEDADDGSIMVTGIASTETRDSTGELILATAIKRALPAYKKYPAIREMHRSTSAAGRAVEITVDDDGVTHLTAHIVDTDAVKKVKTKVYGGFSVGGKVLARDPEDRTIITEISLAEISLVDRPAHPEAAISMWKLDAGISDDDLIKIIGERDNLAKQLSDRDRALAKLADGIERTTAKVSLIIAENARLKTENSDLLKRLALTSAPRVVVDNTSNAQVEQLIGTVEKMVTEAEKGVAELADRFRKAGI